MKRLFWAFSVKDELKLKMSGQLNKTVVAAKKKGLDIKWTPLQNLHVTLVFLGETEGEDVRALVAQAKLVAEKHPPFKLKIKGAGAFPSLKSGRVLWLGVQAKSELLLLQRELAEAMGADDDFPDREYVPHLTIGRLKNKRNLVDTVSPLAGEDFGKVEVNELILYESKLAGSFPVYSPEARLPLGKANKEET